MNGKTTVLFEEALQTAYAVAVNAHRAFSDVRLWRDIRGKIRLIVPGLEEDYQDNTDLVDLGRQLQAELGRYAATPPVMFAGDMSGDDDILSSPEWIPYRPDGADRSIPLMERKITGQNGQRASLDRQSTIPWVTFYSIKGGTGRSTALALWARHLAYDLDKTVLIFDLDLESPGVSNMLLPLSHLPDYGIVDWLVEDAAGQGEAVLPSVHAASPLLDTLKIFVVPSYGQKSGDYLAKLARCYGEFGIAGPEEWAARLLRLMEALEARIQPDVVLLDSRAGLHDIAAMTVTRLKANVLLFGVNSDQTWEDYRMLFEHWRQYHPHIAEFRQKLQMVAALIPETGTEQSLQSFLDNAWNLFLRIYDEISPGEVESEDTFSYAKHDEAAPHTPLPVFWQRALQEFSFLSCSRLSQDMLAASMGMFWKRADELIGLDREHNKNLPSL